MIETKRYKEILEENRKKLKELKNEYNELEMKHDTSIDVKRREIYLKNEIPDIIECIANIEKYIKELEWMEKVRS